MRFFDAKQFLGAAEAQEHLKDNKTDANFLEILKWSFQEDSWPFLVQPRWQSDDFWMPTGFQGSAKRKETPKKLKKNFKRIQGLPKPKILFKIFPKAPQFFLRSIPPFQSHLHPVKLLQRKAEPQIYGHVAFPSNFPSTPPPKWTIKMKKA